MYQPQKFFRTALVLFLAALVVSSASVYAEEEPGTISVVVEATGEGAKLGQRLMLWRVGMPEGVIGVRVYLSPATTETASTQEKHRVASVFAGHREKNEDFHGNFVIILPQRVSGQVRVTLSPIRYKNTKQSDSISLQSAEIGPADNSAFDK